MAIKFPRSTIVAVAPMLLVACSHSEAQAEQPVSPEIAKAVLDWSTCRSAKVVALMPSGRNADDIVDEAFNECRTFEAEAIRVWEKVYGQGTAQQVVALRQRWRSGLIDQVTAERNGSALADPSASWGQCVGRHIPSDLPADASSASIADTALEACGSDLEKVRQGISAKFGAARADMDIERLRLEMRGKAIAMIEAKRQPH